MRNYHVILEDGTERNVRADDFDIDDGMLVFQRSDEKVIVYNDGQWKMVELESQDDRG
jgi:hypothetical protein